jgi:hypothetical protein
MYPRRIDSDTENFTLQILSGDLRHRTRTKDLVVNYLSDAEIVAGRGTSFFSHVPLPAINQKNGNFDDMVAPTDLPREQQAWGLLRRKM